LANKTLREAVDLMASENVDEIPVFTEDNDKEIIGVLTYHDIIAAYKIDTDQNFKTGVNISIKRYGLKILLKGNKLLTSVYKKSKE
jgi:predicted transcriptional regulator